MSETPLSWQQLPYKQKRKWKYKEEDIGGGECYDCGLYYGCDAWADCVVSADVWELINPSYEKGGGLLCFNCMNRRLEFLGLEQVPLDIGSGPFCAYGEQENE